MSDFAPIPPRRGRASATNPPNRFERLHLVEDPAALDEDELRQVPTEFYYDHSRSILARNESPDVPFTYSVNPYRGCEHGCIYCLSGDTPILMADGTTRALENLRPGDAIYGTTCRNGRRRYVKTRVLAHWSTEKPAYRIRLEDGTELVASGDHRFLTERGWTFVTGPRRPHLTTNDRLLGTGALAAPPADDRDYRHEDLCGVVRDAGVLLRKHHLEGQAVDGDASLRVVSVEPLGVRLRLFDITTGTGDFIANGIISHNCYARPSHEYLGLSAGLDFETKILVKENAPALLHEAFQRPSWQPQVVALAGNTDPYQPVERRLELTRKCLRVFLDHRNPVSVITKNYLVTRDLDLLQELAALNLVHVYLSITSLRPDLIGAMEPRTSRPERRLKAIEVLASHGIPTGVMVAPLIPGLTDDEMPAILEAAARCGAMSAGYQILRLPGPVQDLFLDWLQRTFPERYRRVVRRLESLRGPSLTDNRFGIRHTGEGPWAETIRSLFKLTCRRLGLNRSRQALSTEHFRRLQRNQLDLF